MKKYFFFLSIIAFLFLFLPTQTLKAENACVCRPTSGAPYTIPFDEDGCLPHATENPPCRWETNVTGIPSINSSLYSGNAPLKSVSLQPIKDSQGNEFEARTLIGMIIKSILGIVGSIALVMFIYGGFVWMTAAGSSERISKGKDIIIWAVISLAVIFSAYTLVNFVLTGLRGT